MSVLTDLIKDCTALGSDRWVLLGWASQIEDGSDLAYCSKTTVADWCGLGESTVVRTTKRLVAAGIMVPTGETKVWSRECITPVYRMDVQKIIDLGDGGFILNPPSDCTGVQNDIQGSGRFSVSPSFYNTGSAAGSLSGTTDLRSAAEEPPIKAKSEPENLEPKTKNQNRPQHGKKRKLCPDCGGQLSRDENHLLVCKVLNKVSADEPAGKSEAKPKPTKVQLGAYDKELLDSIRKDLEARQELDAQRICVTCGTNQVKSSTSDYCQECWDIKKAGGVKPTPRSADPPPKLPNLRDMGVAEL